MSYDEIMDKWGSVRCKFHNYYKYIFYYVGETEDGHIINAGYGGDSSDIYRYEVENNQELNLSDIYPDRISVTRDGVDVVYWDNY